MNPRLDLGVRPAAEDRIEKVDEVLDVARGGLVFTSAQAQPDVLIAFQELVHRKHRSYPTGLPADSAYPSYIINPRGATNASSSF